jgi:hypothetical protein
MAFDNETRIISKCIVLFTLHEQLTLAVRRSTIRPWRKCPLNQQRSSSQQF